MKGKANPVGFDNINPGKKSYREYLVEGYGRGSTSRLLDQKSQAIINGMKERAALDESGKLAADREE